MNGIEGSMSSVGNNTTEVMEEINQKLKLELNTVISQMEL